jgi:hypothetical protein
MINTSFGSKAGIMGREKEKNILSPISDFLADLCRWQACIYNVDT